MSNQSRKKSLTLRVKLYILVLTLLVGAAGSGFSQDGDCVLPPPVTATLFGTPGHPDLLKNWREGLNLYRVGENPTLDSNRIRVTEAIIFQLAALHSTFPADDDPNQADNTPVFRWDIIARQLREIGPKDLDQQFSHVPWAGRWRALDKNLLVVWFFDICRRMENEEIKRFTQGPFCLRKEIMQFRQLVDIISLHVGNFPPHKKATIAWSKIATGVWDFKVDDPTKKFQHQTKQTQDDYTRFVQTLYFRLISKVYPPANRAQ